MRGAISNSAMRPVVVVLCDPTSDADPCFFQATILRHPDFLFLQAAIEPLDIAVASRMVVRRSPASFGLTREWMLHPRTRGPEASEWPSPKTTRRRMSCSLILSEPFAAMSRCVHPLPGTGSKGPPCPERTFSSVGRIAVFRKVVRIPTFSPFTQRCLFGTLDSSMAVDERSHASVTWSR